jgi:hypothetical protein
MQLTPLEIDGSFFLMDQPNNLLESNVKKLFGLCAAKIQLLDVREETLVQDHMKMPQTYGYIKESPPGS